MKTRKKRRSPTPNRRGNPTKVVHTLFDLRHKALLTAGELALLLGACERQVAAWAAVRKIPRLDLSKRMKRYQLHKVVEALEKFEVPAFASEASPRRKKRPL